MSKKNKQQAAIIAAARQNSNKAREALNEVDYPDEDNGFYSDAEVEEETVEEFEDQDDQYEDNELNEEYEAEIEDLPDHVEEQVQKNQLVTGVNLDEIRGKLSASGSMVLDSILTYMQDMAPNKRMEMKQGARHQAQFWQALKVMFNNIPDPDFNVLYRALLDMFEEHKDGVFKDEMVYRFAEEWPMPEADRAAYRRLVNLMLVTRNAKERVQALKELKNWDYTLEYGLTPDARNRIQNFYGL